MAPFHPAEKSAPRRLRLEVHPDKYHLLYSTPGVDFCGFVLFPDGRIRIRTDSARRFHRSPRKKLCLALAGKLDFLAVRASLTAWIGHARHARSYRLRRAVLSTAGGRTG